jgi:activator of HSP90 ATPase
VKKIIEDKVSSISLSEPNAKVTMTKVNAKGEAELMIRKGKQSVIYDFEVEVEFRGENSENEVEGSFKIVDIN